MPNSLIEEFKKKNNSNFFFNAEPPGAWYTELEKKAAINAIDNLMNWKSNSEYDERKEFEKMFAKYIGTKHAISINGAGTGLDIAMMCLDIEPGDEVISCAINFKGTHLAIIGQGAKLVLCEPNPKTFNIDVNDVERRITSKTRAIVVTHMNGLSADMDELLDLAQKYKHPKFGPLKVIGDAARSCGADYKQTKVGKKGWTNIFSFHTKKLMTTLGEGGMITTDDSDLENRIRQIHAFGEKESWGTNYKLSKVQAAVGLVQLSRLDEMNSMRIQIAKNRNEMLKNVEQLTLPYVPDDCTHVYSYYTLMVPKEWKGEKRDKLMRILDEKYHIGCVVANPPTYKSNKLIMNHTEGQKVPLAEEIGERIFCPSIHPLMTKEENEYIALAITKAVQEIDCGVDINERYK